MIRRCLSILVGISHLFDWVGGEEWHESVQANSETDDGMEAKQYFFSGDYKSSLLV